MKLIDLAKSSFGSRLLVIRQKISIILGFNNADVTVSIIRKLVSKNNSPVIIDVGANIGEFSKQCLEVFPTATIYCVEPQPEMKLIIEKNISHQGIVITAALSSKNGIGNLSRSLVGDRKATLLNSTNNENNSSTKLVTLDKLIEENGINRIDLLKIDTEGHDFEVLRGASTALRENRIDCILFEIVPQLLFSSILPSQIQRYLQDYGFNSFYRVSKILGLIPIETINDFDLGTQNIVAMKNVQQHS